MKKETKRYMIVEYAGTKEREYDTKEELDSMIEATRKYNNRKKTIYICGNADVTLINGKYHVKIHLYNKLSGKNTISDLDELTKNFDKRSLEGYFADKIKMVGSYEPDINIAYFETKDAKDDEDKPLLFGIKYIPVLYKDDLKYFDESYIKNCLMFHAERFDTSFFRAMASEFCFHHVVSNEVEKLYMYADKVDNQGYDSMSLYYVSLDLYRKLIYEREKDGSLIRNDNGGYQISARRKRDFCFFLKNYNNVKGKNSPLRYNGSTTKMKKDYLIDLRNRLLTDERIKSLKLK